MASPNNLNPDSLAIPEDIEDTTNINGKSATQSNGQNSPVSRANSTGTDDNEIKTQEDNTLEKSQGRDTPNDTSDREQETTRNTSSRQSNWSKTSSQKELEPTKTESEPSSRRSSRSELASKAGTPEMKNKGAKGDETKQDDEASNTTETRDTGVGTADTDDEGDQSPKQEPAPLKERSRTAINYSRQQSKLEGPPRGTKSALPRIVHKTWQEKAWDKDFSLLQSRCDRAKPMVDCEPPKFLLRTMINQKKWQVEQTRARWIERENKQLLERIGKILQTRGMVDNKNELYERHKRNERILGNPYRNQRHAELVRITMENQHFLKLLMGVGPHMPTLDLLKDWERNCRIMAFTSTRNPEKYRSLRKEAEKAIQVHKEKRFGSPGHEGRAPYQRTGTEI